MTDKKAMDWATAQDKITERYEKTETLEFDFGDGSFVEFKVRGLSASEYERFESKLSSMAEQKQIDAKKMAKINFRQEPDGDDETAIVNFAKKYYIKHGIVESPEGFKATDEQIAKLPPPIKSGLADAVDQLTNLGIETKQGF